MTFSYDYFTTYDHLNIRYGIQESKGEGTVIFLQGRAEFMEKYSETLADLDRRGLSVYSFDLPGQGHSGRFLPNRQKGHIKDFNDYCTDLDQFMHQVVEKKAKRPFIFLSHSLGGHIALRYLHDHPGRVDRNICISPMIDIVTSPFPQWIARSMAWFSCHVGLSGTYVMGHNDYTRPEFEGNPLSSDPVRFFDEDKEIQKNTDLAMGGITYGWLNAAFKSINILNKPGYIKEIKTPTLIIGAGEDTVVSLTAMEKMDKNLPDSKHTTIKGAKHEILKETDKIRAAFWDEFDRFTGIL